MVISRNVLIQPRRIYEGIQYKKSVIGMVSWLYARLYLRSKIYGRSGRIEGRMEQYGTLLPSTLYGGILYKKLVIGMGNKSYTRSYDDTLLPITRFSGIRYKKGVIGMGNKSYTRSYVSKNNPLNSKIFELFEQEKQANGNTEVKQR